MGWESRQRSVQVLVLESGLGLLQPLEPARVHRLVQVLAVELGLGPLALEELDQGLVLEEEPQLCPLRW